MVIDAHGVLVLSASKSDNVGDTSTSTLSRRSY